MIPKLWTTPTLKHLSYTQDNDGWLTLTMDAGIHRLFAHSRGAGDFTWRFHLSHVNGEGMEVSARFHELNGDLFATLEEMAQALGDENFGDVE